MSRPYQVLKKRADFLRLRRGKRVSTRTCLIQWTVRQDEADVRIGFTVTKKLGNAVTRNRIKRRLREACTVIGQTASLPPLDAVIIARPPALTAPFPQLLDDVRRGLVDATTSSPPKDR